MQKIVFLSFLLLFSLSFKSETEMQRCINKIMNDKDVIYEIDISEAKHICRGNRQKLVKL